MNAPHSFSFADHPNPPPPAPPMARVHDSSHNLPLHSMLFRSRYDLPTTFGTARPGATLANLADAADTSVTALPFPPLSCSSSSSSSAANDHPRARPLKKKKLAAAWKKIKAGGKKVGKGVKKVFTRKREMVIGLPTDFRHNSSAGALGLRDEHGRFQYGRTA